MPDDVSLPNMWLMAMTRNSVPILVIRLDCLPRMSKGDLWRLSRSEAAAHFGLAARGIEVGERGWFFSGRKRLLRGLVGWMKTAEHGVRIITGPPGAGKSAVIGRLATLSDAEYRRDALVAGAAMEGNDTVPPVGVIDVAIHAKEQDARRLRSYPGVGARDYNRPGGLRRPRSPRDGYRQARSQAHLSGRRAGRGIGRPGRGHRIASHLAARRLPHMGSSSAAGAVSMAWLSQKVKIAMAGCVHGVWAGRDHRRSGG